MKCFSRKSLIAIYAIYAIGILMLAYVVLPLFITIRFIVAYECKSFKCKKSFIFLHMIHVYAALILFLFNVVSNYRRVS